MYDVSVASRVAMASSKGCFVGDQPDVSAAMCDRIACTLAHGLMSASGIACCAEAVAGGDPGGDAAAPGGRADDPPVPHDETSAAVSTRAGTRPLRE
ncbi:hypothetical protein GCM10028772_01080 [Nocardioides ultimimeridianus]